MASVKYNFNKILNDIIKKSSFTRRNVEIMLSEDHRQLQISSGAYYRQKGQVRQKAESIIYSIVLLQALDLLPKGSLNNIEQMSESVRVILESDISEESDIVSLLDEIVRRVVM
ncbi:MAG: hypothetical protein F4202_02645 [Cenarchaeum sp. SB0677_bin_16]|nr:hypothetical protein [Cenarchaeum sp. SB0677_bin_16]